MIKQNGSAKSDDRKTVLVVEDELFIRINIADYLRDCGFQVVEASNGEEAKAVIESGRVVNVVFSDVQMPGELDGFGLARRVRQHRPDIHVILNSGMVNAAEKAGDLCEDGRLMAKPYEEAQVVARIQEMLRAANQPEL
ncbi:MULTISPECIES: response regulator [unclassified Brevundimonas]|uniref:response regulator n=1 Tax=unclassified Brevundimonas TaxID=2622653 RepID=UPI0025C58718|nr:MULTISPECIES: response regulator [unclassified Brevundimonas]